MLIYQGIYNVFFGTERSTPVSVLTG